MSKGKKVTIGYRYRLGFHLVLCQGGADAIIKIRYEDRVAWTGNITANQTLTINQPNLFGGDKKQGGLEGKIDFMFGGEAQAVNNYLAFHSNKTIIPTYLGQFDLLGGDTGWTQTSGGGNTDIVSNGGVAVPAYRGVVSMVFKRFMYGAMNPYLKPFRITVRRIPKTLGASNATITINGRQNANPAHMIYDILTNKQWGQGLEDGDINLTSFTTAAATLASEGFGLSLLWKQENTAEDFINLIMSHISATLYPDPSTGQYTLKLLRNDYTIGTLMTLDETNILSMRSYQRTSTNDLTNELTVEYYEPDNEQDAKVTVQNLAALRSVGKVVRRVIQYPGIRDGDLAARVAQRDLLAFSTPLAKLNIEVNLSAWNLRPGDVFKFSWAKLGITSVVFRVLEIEYGGLRDNKITITAVEDLFAVPAASYIGTQAPIWQTVPTSLSDITTYKFFDAPYYTLIQYFGEEYATTLADNRNFVSVIAPRANGLWSDFKLHELVSGSYVERDAGTFAPFVTVTDAMTQTQTSVVYTGFFDLDLVTVGSLGVIDNEWVAVDAINTTTQTLTIKRGVLDSIPATHAAGAIMYLYGDSYLLDEDTDRYATESVTYKLQPTAAGDELALANATARGYTVNGRQQRPYPPGNVTINSLYFPEIVNEIASVSWAHRDRTLQTAAPIAWTNGNIGPETGVTYTVSFYAGASATLVNQATGLTTTSYVATDAQLGENTDLRLELKTVRNSIDNFQTFIHRFTRIVNRSIYALRILSDSPLGYWRLNDVAPSTTLSDSSVNNRSGTLSNTTLGADSLLIPADTNKAVSFNGTSSYAAVPYVAALAPTAAVTVELWAKFASFPASPASLISKTESGGYNIGFNYTSAGVPPNVLSFALRRNGVYAYPYYSTPLNLNQIYHIVGTYDGRYARLYIDGVLVSTDDAGGNFPITYASNNSLTIGAESGAAATPSGEYFNGTIDEASVYGSALPADAVLARYKIGVNRLSYREDGFRDKVVLLMTMNGAAGVTTFAEASGKTVTTVGNTVYSSAQAKFGTTSAYLDGTGDYLRLPPSADYAFGTGDFTVECWVYQTNTSAWRITNRLEWSGSNGTWGFNILPTTVGFSQVIAGEPGTLGSGLSSVQNQWVHYAASRSKGFIRLYRNGVMVASGTDTTDYNSSAYDLKIGVSDSSSSLGGYIDGVRITRGARYSTTTIPVPVETFPDRAAISETLDPFWGDKTVLLMHFDGANGSTTFTDQKSHTVTPSGNAQISTAQNKFGGASGIFDGNGDYLDVSGGAEFDLGVITASTELTVEFWVRMVNLSGDQVIVSHANPGSGGNGIGGWRIWSASGKVQVHFSKNSSAGSAWYFLLETNNVVLSTSGWKHVAVVLFEGFPYIYVDGALQAATVNTSSGIYASTPLGLDTTRTTYGLRIGATTTDSTNPSPDYFLNGYIDELRITRACRYFGNFAPQNFAYPNDGISQFSTVTGTGTMTAQSAAVVPEPLWKSVEILIQPAGADGSTTFTDSSQNNWTVTRAGNAQVDTGVLIGGQPTLLCDGSGDYLSIADNPLLEPGAADFTIECWFRATAVTAQQVLFHKRATTADYGTVFVDILGGNVRFLTSYNGTAWGAQDLTSGAVVAGTTYHLALERFGSTIKLYLNGVETGSAAVTGSLHNNNSAWFYGSEPTANSFNGNLGPLRATFGTARYKGAFTPPTLPFAVRVTGDVQGDVSPTGPTDLAAQSATMSGTGAVTDVVLLMRMNGTNGSTSFVDQTGKTVTAIGNAQISTAQSQYGGASAYFDGNGDYLTVANSADFAFGTGDFTVEYWTYPLSSNSMGLDTRSFNTDDTGLVCNTDPGIQLAVYRFPTPYLFTDLVPAINAWNHVAFVRSAGVVYAYLNGVKSTTSHAFAFSFTSQLLTIGTNINNRSGGTVQPAQWAHGYMDDLRIIKGTALYTANFTPPGAL